MASQSDPSVLQRGIALGYGLLAYFAFLLFALYYIGFLANVGVPKGIDDGPVVPLAEAVAIDIGLISLFGIQHSVMARQWFKEFWTQIVPKPVERSTYVLFASIVLLAIAWLWRPVPSVIWEFEGAAAWALWGIYGLGWLIIVLSSFQISHTELFGLQQVYAYFQGREPSTVPFQTPGFYRYVRHPLMTGTILAFWATPHMTVGHLIFAVTFTIYILVGVHLEERMLVDAYGDEYRQYRRTTPMLIPRPWRSAPSANDETDGTAE